MTDVLAGGLAAVLATREVSNLERLSGGANMETWSFTAEVDGEPRALILRRQPEGDQVAATDAMVGEVPIEVEAQLIRLASSRRVPTPEVIHVLAECDGLGRGFIMSRERGEALPQKLLADPRFASAREAMPYACGATMARIHQVPVSSVPEVVPRRSYSQQLAHFQTLLDRFGNTSPVHQLGLNYLADHPPAERPMALVHGDFRNGNLLVDETGLSAVLDWELAHVGHPWEDLGYFCANVWRFGRYDLPAGGFGDYEPLLEGYRSVAGEAPTLEALKHWELVAALNWGLVTQTMVAIYDSGQDPRLERAAVGRRLSESEVDILLLLEELGAMA